LDGAELRPAVTSEESRAVRAFYHEHCTRIAVYLELTLRWQIVVPTLGDVWIALAQYCAIVGESYLRGLEAVGSNLFNVNEASGWLFNRVLSLIPRYVVSR